jgi:hypothetical protein
MTSKDKAKLGLATGLLLLAVVLFMVLTPRKGQATELDEAKTQWYCSACKSGFSLTGAQTAAMARLHRPPSKSPSDAIQPRRPGRDIIEITKCPFCGEWAGIPARSCPDCGETFPSRAKNGAIAICPACKWDPTTGRKAEGARVRLGEE